MKKLLLLGGSRFLLPVIKAAKKLGYHTITCDYLPNNIAHKYSDEYSNVSITDKKAVLETARKLRVDGIMSFACDPGVVTAAYVAEQMGLPHCGSYEAVSILQNKWEFRRFLRENGFRVPMAKGYHKMEDALKDVDLFPWPVIVKPVDSAGSKGVVRVDSMAELRKGIEYALAYSHCKEFIIEQFLPRKGHSSDSDSFSIDGELVFTSFSSQRFDDEAANPYTPAAFSWPASISDGNQGELTGEIQRLLRLLNMRTSIYNIETRECLDGNAYIMECSPRGGGNRLAEMLRYMTGVDLIENAVRAAVGDALIPIRQNPPCGFWAEIILHRRRRGIFGSLWTSDAIAGNIVEQDLWVKQGDMVEGFRGANEAIGTLVLRFDSQERMEEVLAKQDQHVKVGIV